MTDYQLLPSRDLTILIPARAGSKRVLNKNTRDLGGKPLIQWTIEPVKEIGCPVIVSTDDLEVAGAVAMAYGCQLHERQPAHATDDAPDFLWVNDLRERIQTPYFAICRPTSPFRTASTIRRCYAAFLGSGADSIRAVSKVTSPHPGKMWMREGRVIRPVLSGKHPDGTPYHSSPTQSLPEVYVQNASLEMAHRWVIDTGTISGSRIAPFFTDDLEGFDINTEADFTQAELIALGLP